MNPGVRFRRLAQELDRTGTIQRAAEQKHRAGRFRNYDTVAGECERGSETRIFLRSWRAERCDAMLVVSIE